MKRSKTKHIEVAADRILEIMRSDPTKEYKTTELQRLVNTNQATARFAVKRLSDRGAITPRLAKELTYWRFCEEYKGEAIAFYREPPITFYRIPEWVDPTGDLSQYKIS